RQKLRGSVHKRSRKSGLRKLAVNYASRTLRTGHTSYSSKEGVNMDMILRTGWQRKDNFNRNKSSGLIHSAQVGLNIDRTSLTEVSDRHPVEVRQRVQR